MDTESFIRSKATKLGRPLALLAAVAAATGSAFAAKPVLQSIPDQTVNEGQTVNFTASATDADSGDTLTYGIENNPSGSSINPTTGQFSWTTTESDGPGTYTVKVKVTDSTSNTVSKEVKINVKEVNQPPVIDITGTTLNEGQNIHTSVGHDDDIPANLTFSATNLPAGATVNSSTGIFDWTPSESQGGLSFNVTFKITDGKATVTSTVTFNVTELNSPPVLDLILDRYSKGGQSISFAIKATDSDIPKQTITYSLDANATTATINPTTGQFTWTNPPNVVDDTPFDFTVNATDNGTGPGSDSQTFRIILTTRDLTKPVGGVTFGSELYEVEGPFVTVHYWVRNNTLATMYNVKIVGDLNGVLTNIGDVSIQATNPFATAGDTTTNTFTINKTHFNWNHFDLPGGGTQQDMYISIYMNPFGMPVKHITDVAYPATLTFDAINLVKPAPTSTIPYDTVERDG